MNTPSSPILVVLCGATATGKSGLALQLAEKYNSVILSADSRQVYRDFDIGTAKPTAAERDSIPHYLLDIADPRDTLTLAQYQETAGKPIATLPHRPLFLVGGTGLYIRSIVRGLKIPRVSPRPDLRQQLQSLGQGYLHRVLASVDPASAAKIHGNDEVRTLRALEVFYATGKPISEQQGENPPNYPILQIGLDCEPDILQKRIEQRTRGMVEMGFVEEVKALSAKYGPDLPLLDTLGYAEMKRYLAGEISLEEAIDTIVLHTRQFAKRQRTWFRADPSIHWFPAESEDLLEQVYRKITEFLETVSPFDRKTHHRDSILG
jgi:tRNA dimethylallyltransferase